MLVEFEDELLDPYKVSFIGAVKEEVKKPEKSGNASVYTVYVMFKYIVDGVVLSAVRETMEIPAGDSKARSEIVRPVREHIDNRRKFLFDLVKANTNPVEA